MRPAPLVLTLALAFAGAGDASADRFSRPLCKKLKVEYADALTTGAKSDMEQGPEWAQANLPRHRLENIERLINLEAELEFRCSMSRNRIAQIKPERKPVIPEVPERKELPDPPSQTAKAELEAPPAAGAPADKPAAAAPGTQKPAAKAAKSETAAINSQSSPAKPDPTATKPDAKADAKPTQPPAKVATQQAKKPTRPKKNNSGNGYVSPREVSPFGLYRNGSTW